MMKGHTCTVLMSLDLTSEVEIVYRSDDRSRYVKALDYGQMEKGYTHNRTRI